MLSLIYIFLFLLSYFICFNFLSFSFLCASFFLHSISFYHQFMQSFGFLVNEFLEFCLLGGSLFVLSGFY